MSLELHDVNLSYPDGDRTLTALSHVDLTVGAGELVAVTGPSGSGKSSLLGVAGLLLRPGSGRVWVAGVDTGTLRGSARATLRRTSIGFVFQQTNLIASLSAVGQLLAVAHLSGRRITDERERALELLDAVGVADKARRRPHELSGGERQRVGVARALMNSPRLLLVDEPTSALDHERGAAVMELLQRLTEERDVATVVVTHDLGALRGARRVTTLTDGRLTEDDFAANG